MTMRKQLLRHAGPVWPVCSPSKCSLCWHCINCPEDVCSQDVAKCSKGQLDEMRRCEVKAVNKQIPSHFGCKQESASCLFRQQPWKASDWFGLQVENRGRSCDRGIGRMRQITAADKVSFMCQISGYVSADSSWPYHLFGNFWNGLQPSPAVEVLIQVSPFA